MVTSAPEFRTPSHTARTLQGRIGSCSSIFGKRLPPRRARAECSSTPVREGFNQHFLQLIARQLATHAVQRRQRWLRSTSRLPRSKRLPKRQTQKGIKLSWCVNVQSKSKDREHKLDLSHRRRRQSLYRSHVTSWLEIHISAGSVLPAFSWTAVLISPTLFSRISRSSKVSPFWPSS